MTPAIRVKFGLLILTTGIFAAFGWNGASGQFRPPGSRFNPPRGFNPGMNRPGGIGGMNRPGGISIGWKCPKCGHTGEGMIPPQTCPGCGVTFVNGVGNGSAGGVFGNPAGPGRNPNPGFNPPGTNPPFVDPNPPVMNPGGPPPGQPPAFNPPPVDNSSNPSLNPPTEENKSSAKRPLMIVLVVGIIVVGVSVLLGGALLVIYHLRNGNSSSSRRTSRRYRDEYDD